MFSFRPSPSLFFGEGRLHQGSSGSRGLWFGQGEWNNTLLNCTSHQGKVNCDHSHADRSILISIHLLPLPVMADAIACAAFGSLPLPISNIYAPLFFLQRARLRSLSQGDKTRAVLTLLKIDYMDSFVSINNSVIPTEKSEFTITDGKTGRKAPERCGRKERELNRGECERSEFERLWCTVSHQPWQK